MTSARLPYFGFLAVCVWPIVNFLGHNYAVLKGYALGMMGEVAAIGLVIVVAGTVVIFGFGRFFRGGAGTLAVAATVLVPAFFAFVPGRIAAAQLLNFIGIPRGAAILYFLAAAVLAGLALFYGHGRGVRRLVAIFAFAGLAAATASLIAAASLAKNDNAPQARSGAISAAPFSGENVYYVILDGFAGRGALKSVLGYDHAPFLDAMAARGFYSARDAHSNFLNTFLTLSAIFRADYVVEQGSARYTSREGFYPALLREVPPPALIETFLARGYDLQQAGNKWAGCERKYMRCISDPAGIIGYGAQMLLHTTPIGFLTDAISGQTDTIDALHGFVENLNPGRPPFLVFAHHLAPHAPYSRDPDCNPRVASRKIATDWKKAERRFYRDAVICLDKRVLRLADDIVARDPNAIVVFQADHGSGFTWQFNKPLADWTEEDFRERADFMNLIRAPEPCRQWLRPDLGQINTVRFVIGCLQRRAPDYVSEKTVLTTYEGAEDYGRARDFVFPP